jgi:hypothetical protein
MPLTEYSLIPVPEVGKVIPDEVKSGGYFYHEGTEKMVGWYDYLNSGNLTELTKSQFIARELKYNQTHPYLKEDRTPMTEAEVVAFVSDWYDSFFDLNINTNYTPEQLEQIKNKKTENAFITLEKNIDNSNVEVYISSVSANCTFGCDKTTQENIIGINVAISRNVNIPDPIYWNPKGSINPVQVTHDELAEIGGKIFNKKNDNYMVYFGHKSNILSSNDIVYIEKYDFNTGY